MDNELMNTLRLAIQGHADSFQKISTTPHSELVTLASETNDLCVDVGDIKFILVQILEHKISLKFAQKWASFVRRGYVSGMSKGPIQALTINCLQQNEDLIVEILTRLDEVGDSIDGSIECDEIKRLANMLDQLN